MWFVEVRIGTIELEATEWDGIDRGTDPPLPQLVELRMTDELEEGRGWPLRQGPSTVQLSFLVAQASDAAAITSTSTVEVRYFRHVDDTAPVASFYGRSSDPKIRPHALGALVSVTCVDYLTDLADPTVGSVDYPAEDAHTRLVRLFDAAGEPPPVVSGPSPFSVWPQLPARAASVTSLLAEAQATLAQAALLRQVFVPQPLSWVEVFELRPNIDPATGRLDATEPWMVAVLDRSVDSVPALELVYVDGVWELSAPTEADPGVSIPAEVTSFDAEWARRPVGDINTVDVALADNSIKRVSNMAPGEKRVTDRIETQLTDAADAERLGTYYLPDHIDSPGAAWEAERFTVLPDLEDDAGARVAPAGWWPGELRESRLLVGIDPTYSPEARSWWPGYIAEREVQLADGETTVELAMRARPVVAGPDAVAFSELPVHQDPDAGPQVTVHSFAGGRPATLTRHGHTGSTETPAAGHTDVLLSPGQGYTVAAPAGGVDFTVDLDAELLPAGTVPTAVNRMVGPWAFNPSNGGNGATYFNNPAGLLCVDLSATPTYANAFSSTAAVTPGGRFRLRLAKELGNQYRAYRSTDAGATWTPMTPARVRPDHAAPQLVGFGNMLGGSQSMRVYSLTITTAPAVVDVPVRFDNIDPAITLRDMAYIKESTP